MTSASATSTLSLALLVAGLALAICGTAASFVWRKAGVTGWALWMAGSSAVAHPERYVRPDRVRAIRILNMSGMTLFLAGVLVLVARGLWPVS